MPPSPENSSRRLLSPIRSTAMIPTRLSLAQAEIQKNPHQVIEIPIIQPRPRTKSTQAEAELFWNTVFARLLLTTSPPAILTQLIDTRHIIEPDFDHFVGTQSPSCTGITLVYRPPQQENTHLKVTHFPTQQFAEDDPPLFFYRLPLKDITQPKNPFAHIIRGTILIFGV